MKELSIEEKAKAYDKVVERLKDFRFEYRFSAFGDVIEEKFPELKESEGERIRKALIDYFRWNPNSQLLNEFTNREVFAWLEKQGKQKSIDKVEPKFKVGDWITNIIETVQITGYDIDYGYQVDYKGKLQHRDTDIIEKEYHLWTIQDAKDGDVLSDGTTIFMFKDLLSDGSVISHCDYDTDTDESDAFCPSSVNLICSKITPATKEQRDTLMKAMTDAGYTFDFERKELKKIEPKFKVGDYIKPIDKCLGSPRIIEEVYDGWYVTDKGALYFEFEDNWELVEKPAWSEEDEDYFDAIITKLEITQEDAALTDNQMEFLKSLKERYTWKPSDEQMTQLKKYCPDNRLLTSLYEQLKKLRGE